MSLDAAMADACRAIGIVPPARVTPGRWIATPAEGKARSNTAGRVMIEPGMDRGVAWNWLTGERRAFDARGTGEAGQTRRNRQAEAAELRAAAARHEEAAAICARIVRACTPAQHPYLAAKGFPDERALVIDALRPQLPTTSLGQAMARALPDGEGPWLIVPGWCGRQITTVQIIGPGGAKKNILGGRMGGASLRIATGRETWVCEGIATALSVRAALRLLGRSTTVLAAFSASNVAAVARALPGAIIAADHDRPLDQLGGLGTGEYYARASGCQWVQPPELGDWNDMHQRDGLRAVAMALREVRPP